MKLACLACILSAVSACLNCCAAIPPGASFRLPLPKQGGTINWEAYDESLFPAAGK